MKRARAQLATESAARTLSCERAENLQRELTSSLAEMERLGGELARSQEQLKGTRETLAKERLSGVLGRFMVRKMHARLVDAREQRARAEVAAVAVGEAKAQAEQREEMIHIEYGKARQKEAVTAEHYRQIGIDSEALVVENRVQQVCVRARACVCVCARLGECVHE